MKLRVLHTFRSGLPTASVMSSSNGISSTVKAAIAQASHGDSFTAEITGAEFPAKSITTPGGSRAVVVAASLGARDLAGEKPHGGEPVVLLWFDERSWQQTAASSVASPDLLKSASVMVLERGQANAAFPELAGIVGMAPLVHLPALDDAVDTGELDTARDRLWTISDRVIYIPRDNDVPYPLDKLPGSLVEFSYRKSAQVFVEREIYLVRARQDFEKAVQCEMGFSIYVLDAYARSVILMLPFSSSSPHAAGPHHILEAGMKALLGTSNELCTLPRHAYGFLKSGRDGGAVIVDIANGNLYERNSGVSRCSHPFKSIRTAMALRAIEMLGTELDIDVSMVGVREYAAAQEAKMNMPRYGMR